MNKRQIITVVSVLVFIVALVVSNRMSTPSVVPAATDNKAPIRTVTAKIIYPKDVAPRINFNGRLFSIRHIDVIPEVTGTVAFSSTRFQEGARFKKGDVLFSIDSDEFRLNLLAQKAAFISSVAQLLPDIRIDYRDNFKVWEGYFQKLDVNKSFAELPKPATEKEKLFVAARGITSQFYQIKSAENRLAKFQIRAPFNGAVTLSNVKEGAAARAGVSVGRFVDTDNYELKASIPNDYIRYVSIGAQYRLISQNGEEFIGTVGRLGAIVDVNTQMTDIFLSVISQDVKEGMYLSGSFLGEPLANVVQISRNNLVNGEGIFVVRDSLLTKLDVKTRHVNGDSVLIEGVKGKEILVTQKLENAAQGIKINAVVQ